MRSLPAKIQIMAQVRTGDCREANLLVRMITKLRRAVLSLLGKQRNGRGIPLPRHLARLRPNIIQPRNVVKPKILKHIISAAGSDVTSVTRASNRGFRCNANTLIQAMRHLAPREAHQVVQRQIDAAKGSKRSSTTALPAVRRPDGSLTNTTQETADTLADFYQTGGSPRAKDDSRTVSLQRFKDILLDKVDQQAEIDMFLLDDADDEQIVRAIKMLKAGRATGPSGIPTSAVRLSYTVEQG